LSEVLKSNCLF